jgi:hypothetical protein
VTVGDLTQDPYGTRLGRGVGSLVVNLEAGVSWSRALPRAPVLSLLLASGSACGFSGPRSVRNAKTHYPQYGPIVNIELR